MEPLNATATEVLRSLFERQPNTPAKVACAWKIAGGPAIARASVVEWREDGVLTVRVASDAWKREIRRAKPMIAERLRHLLGPSVVRRIVVADARG